jgi:hypothetical protein
MKLTIDFLLVISVLYSFKTIGDLMPLDSLQTLSPQAAYFLIWFYYTKLARKPKHLLTVELQYGEEFIDCGVPG